MMSEGLPRVLTLPPIAKRGRGDEIQAVLLYKMKQDLGGLSDDELESLEAELEGRSKPPQFHIPAAKVRMEYCYDLARLPRLSTSRPSAMLGQAVESWQSLEEQIVGCARRAAQMIKTKDPRAIGVLKKLSAMALFGILKRASGPVVRVAFAKWRFQSHQLKRELKMIAYRRYQGSRRLFWCWFKHLRKEIERAWSCWIRLVMTQRQLERESARYRVALGLQCAWRSLRARNARHSLLRSAKTIRIQAWFRCLRSRCAYLAYRAAIRRVNAVLTIQNSLYRSVRARRERRRLSFDRALLVLQCWWRIERARNARMRAHRTRQLNRAVSLVQRVARGIAGRQLAASRADLVRKDAFARRLQTLIKAFVQRRIALRHSRLRAEQSAKELLYAVKMQALFRGNRSRAVNELRRRRDVLRKIKYAQAAVCMQKIARRFTALRRANRLRAEVAAMDGRELSEKAMKRNYCSECEKVIASRLCDQCQDQFCAACFAEVHASPETGQRREHTYVNINFAECSECYGEIASVFCRNCDDYFCSQCFDHLHVGRTNHEKREIPHKFKSY